MASFRKRTSTNNIIVHCSATRPDQDIGIKTIRLWHMRDNGWFDVGYHFVIKRSGELEIGRPVDVVGAHTKGFNSDSVSICLIGGINNKGKADANFTIEQLNCLKDLIGELKDMYPDAQVKGHRDFNNGKECPSFDVQALLANIK